MTDPAVRKMHRKEQGDSFGGLVTNGYEKRKTHIHPPGGFSGS